MLCNAGFVVSVLFCFVYRRMIFPVAVVFVVVVKIVMICIIREGSGDASLKCIFS